MLENFFEFWWMFPVAFCICLIATSSSVEGAVFFAPIFILAFPFVAGVKIIPIEAIFLALSIELFGFGSAMIGYLRRGLIDLSIVKKVLPVSVPVGMGFGFLAHLVPSQMLLRYLGGLMIVLSVLMLYSYFTGGVHEPDGEQGEGLPTRVDSLGRRYWYKYEHGPIGMFWSGFGGVLVGLTGIGIGELATTILILRNKLPVRVAIGTGIMIVFFTAFMATLVHAYVFSSGELNVHWNVLFMTIPAVTCGGQVSPYINSRMDGEKMKAFLSLIFILVGGLLILRGVE